MHKNNLIKNEQIWSQLTVVTEMLTAEWRSCIGLEIRPCLSEPDQCLLPVYNIIT